ncbi:hypothetical protein BASA60_011476 [Batrachochytrium salamandrivorans]|nr:hypothetical protein BASA60_011476 [Batrachochytrium salamandrivorans]
MDASVWVQRLVSVHLGNETAGETFNGLASSKELERFLGDVHVPLLLISLNSKTDIVKCSTNIDDINDTSRAVIISKTRPAIVTAHNMTEIIQITQFQESPLNTLYQSVHSVYTPILQQSGKLGVNSKLQRLLADLDEGLASSIRHSPNSQQTQENHLGSIYSIENEYSYWIDIASQKGNDSSEGRRAIYFRDALEPLKSDFEAQRNQPFPILLQIAEKCYDVLDAIWRQTDHLAYPRSRMSHLLELISEQIIGAIQDKIGVRNIMSEPLSQILSLRTSHDALLNVVQLETYQDTHADDALKFFEGLNMFQCSKSIDMAWTNAISQYNRIIEPVELQCAQRLSAIFGALQAQPSQLLREFQKYRELVRRENIFRQLVTERETLFGQLSSSLKSIHTEFRNRTQHISASKGRNLPNIITDIVWSRQTLAKIQETDQLVESLIGKKSTYQESSSKLYEELRQYESDLFENWVSNTTSMLDNKNGDATLGQSDQLMELDYSSGKLIVNYGDHLVVLFREIRLLIAMGFPVPAQIQKSANSAQKLYRHGVVLKQVAHFYNTIDQQMLPSQQTMLLQLALAFEQLVKNPKSGNDENSISATSEKQYVSWGTPQELERYITRLQAAAENLTSENRRLRKYHVVISDYIIALMSVDLVKNQARWKEILTEIRKIIDTIQDGGIKPELTLTWRNHWDYQLYKALEYQYQVGLESLNESLPEIKVDLIFKQKRLQFRPPI